MAPTTRDVGHPWPLPASDAEYARLHQMERATLAVWPMLEQREQEDTTLAEPAPDDAVHLGGHEPGYQQNRDARGRFGPGNGREQGSHEAGGTQGSAGAGGGIGALEQHAHGGQGIAPHTHPGHTWTPGDVAHAPTVEEIKATIARNGGVHTADEAIAIGHMVRDRVHAEMGWSGYGKLQEYLHITKQVNAEAKAHPEDAHAQEQAERMRNFRNVAISDYSHALREHTVSVLGQLRELGGVPLAPVATAHGSSDPAHPQDLQVAQAVFRASHVLPRDWLEASNAAAAAGKGTLRVSSVLADNTHEVVGGNYRHDLLHDGGVITVSAGRHNLSPDAMQTMATHELGHRFESTVPRLANIEEQFYERRTDGENWKSLQNYPGKYRTDRFANPYMGRLYDYASTGGPDHQGMRPFELLSMGQEWLLGPSRNTERALLLRDPEYHALILGMLAGA